MFFTAPMAAYGRLELPTAAHVAAHDGPWGQPTEAHVAFSKPGMKANNKTVHGRSGKPVAVSGSPCPPMAARGSPWQPVVAHGNPWHPGASHDSSWHPIAAIVAFHVAPYGRSRGIPWQPALEPCSVAR